MQLMQFSTIFAMMAFLATLVTHHTHFEEVQLGML